MDRRGLSRLRIGFTFVGLLLLLPLFFLLRSAEARFEEQRRLRHEIVAERIFDEMERELTTLLAAERQRPSSAYDARNTRVASWAPFVVGYFKANRDGIQLVAREQLTAERAARARVAVRAALDDRARAGRRSSTAQPTRLGGSDKDREAMKAEEEARIEAGKAAAIEAAEKAATSATHSRRRERSKGEAAKASEEAPHSPRRKAAAQAPEKKAAAPDVGAAPAAPAAAKQDVVLRQLNRGAEDRQKKLKRRSAPVSGRTDNDDPLSGLDGL